MNIWRATTPRRHLCPNHNVRKKTIFTYCEQPSYSPLPRGSHKKFHSFFFYPSAYPNTLSVYTLWTKERETRLRKECDRFSQLLIHTRIIKLLNSDVNEGAKADCLTHGIGTNLAPRWDNCEGCQHRCLEIRAFFLRNVVGCVRNVTQNASHVHQVNMFILTRHKTTYFTRSFPCS